MVDVVRALYADVVYIARNMRDLDAEEIFPLTWTGKPEDLAMGICASGGISNVALCSGRPVAAWGAHMTRPKMWSVWMFSTNQWPTVALTVTRNIRKVMMPSMIDSGAVRADCWSMEGHHVAHRWLEILGATVECSAEDYGATRKKFFCYSWTRSRLERDGDFDYVRRTVSPKNAKAAAPSAPAPCSDAAPNQGRSTGKRGSYSKTQTGVSGKGSKLDYSVGAIG